MEIISIFKRAFFATALMSSLFLLSCENNADEIGSNTFTLSGNASGSQEVPAVTTSGSATLNGSYNANTNSLTYTINWSGLSGAAAAAHFHGPALTGFNADVLIGLNIATNGVSGTASGTVIIPDSTENHLLGGRVYYNIHTALHPAGEIRGQIVATAD